MLNTPAFVPHKEERVLLIGIQSPRNKTKNIASYFQEFETLARSNKIKPLGYITIKLRSIDPGYFVTQGKLEELKKACDEYQPEKVVFSEPLSPQQERNLGDYLDCTIIDRTRLILEIFEKNAHSAEGKTQVAIAMFQHQKTRLAGKGIFLEQQFGVKGTRGGPGETAKEKERRIIDDYVSKLKDQLKKLEKTRDTQRKQRLAARLPLICLVGYTNAGKSTLLNQLTQSSVLSEDRLFATLDTTVREWVIDGKKQALLADTVGFIQQLPPQLIAAFKSTLAELQYAHLLLHVVDTSDINWPEHIEVVNTILAELRVTAPMLYVFNKIDKASTKDKTIYNQYTPQVFTNAQSKTGVKPLIAWVHEWISMNTTKTT